MSADKFFSGSDLLVYIGAEPIGHSRSCSFSMSQNLADATTKSNNGFMEYVPTTRGWELSCDGLGVWNENINQFFNAINDRTPLIIKFSPRNAVSGTTYYSGTAYIESFDVSGEMEDGVTYSVSMKGSGILSGLTSV